MNVQKLLFNPLLILLCLIAGYSQTPTPTPCVPACETNKNTPPAARKGWEPGSTVYYYIDPSITNPDTIRAIQDAFTNWTNSSAENGSYVTYQPSLIPPSTIGNGTLNSIEIKAVDNIPLRNELGQAIPGQSARAEVTDIVTDVQGYTTSATIEIDKILTNYNAALESFSHEVGHPAGFSDCNLCDAGTSIMSLVPYDSANKATFNTAYGRTTTPTCCDKEKLRKIIANPNNYLSGGGGGGQEPPSPNPVYYCTPYYWVYYLSWDEGQSWEVVDVQYAGCW
jgi:hypothetical protein